MATKQASKFNNTTKKYHDLNVVDDVLDAGTDTGTAEKVKMFNVNTKKYIDVSIVGGQLAIKIQ